ncbi:MAG: hypothetical protein IJY79_06925 [Clostridia bacterium]|nr:hypothetical protein [Clostridia bacterium]
MFTIDIDFLGQQPPRAPYSRMSLDEMYGYLIWEACLTVTYNNQILFSEEVAIIEFYWYLVNWYRRYLTGNAVQFVYSTVEHTEPILVFSPQQNQYWKIDSVWKQCDKPALIKEEILHSEVHKLLEGIMVAIEA